VEEGLEEEFRVFVDFGFGERYTFNKLKVFKKL
jgi:hypothetical protein